MKKNLTTLTLILVLAISGCQKDIQQSAEPKDSEIATARSGSPANGTVYLIVTVDDATAGNQVLSDNGTPYTHGMDRVDARLMSSDGTFYMNTNNNTVKAPIRTMQFLPDATDFDLSGNRNYSLRTEAPKDPSVNGGNTVWIQNLALNQSQRMGLRAWGVDQQGVADWRLQFRNGPQNNSSSLTDYVIVTKTGINPDTWTIEPAGISSPGANAKLVDGNGIAFGSEYYATPFKLTLVRK